MLELEVMQTMTVWHKLRVLTPAFQTPTGPRWKYYFPSWGTWPFGQQNLCSKAGENKPSVCFVAFPGDTNSCCKIPGLDSCQTTGSWAQKTKPWLMVNTHHPWGEYRDTHMHAFTHTCTWAQYCGNLDSVTWLFVSWWAIPTCFWHDQKTFPEPSTSFSTL